MERRRVMARTWRRPSLRRCNLSKHILRMTWYSFWFYWLGVAKAGLEEQQFHAPEWAGGHHPLRGADRLHQPICNILPQLIHPFFLKSEKWWKSRNNWLYIQCAHRDVSSTEWHEPRGKNSLQCNLVMIRHGSRDINAIQYNCRSEIQGHAWPWW